LEYSNKLKMLTKDDSVDIDIIDSADNYNDCLNNSNEINKYSESK